MYIAPLTISGHFTERKITGDRGKEKEKKTLMSVLFVLPAIFMLYLFFFSFVESNDQFG